MPLRLPSSLAVLLVLAACAARAPLAPAPEARVLPEREQAAVASAGGVRVTADASAWDGFPSPLRTVVPVRVRIENGAQVPLRLSLDAFSLRLEEGTSLAALPPMEVQGTELVTTPPPPSGYGGAGLGPGWVDPHLFHPDALFAPPLGVYGPGLSPWGGPFRVDPFYADPFLHGSAWRSWPVQLPTPDMVARALPEGVLEPGGRAEGFIYFQGLPGDAQRATLQVVLVDARGGEPLGRAQIPFDYRGR